MAERIHVFVITGRCVIDVKRLEVVLVDETIEPSTVQSIGSVAFRVDDIQYILENLVRRQAILEYWRVQVRFHSSRSYITVEHRFHFGKCHKTVAVGIDQIEELDEREREGRRSLSLEIESTSANSVIV